MDASSIEVEVSVKGIEPGMSLRAKVELVGDQVLEDTISVRSSLVERSLPLLRAAKPLTHRTWPAGLALPCGAPRIPSSTTCGSNSSIPTARPLTVWRATSGCARSR